MSLSLLLEKYDVSTDEGLQKALAEIEKEENEAEEALNTAICRAGTLQSRLHSVKLSNARLEHTAVNAVSASSTAARTAELARDVSAKVRQLDLARSRVAECQHRVQDLIDLQLCSAGVEAAIKAQDYETGAAHVSRFLSMDPGSVAAARARGAPDPRDTMARAANTLRTELLHRFEEAARKEDEAAIDRLFKLFPQLGCAAEGVDLLAKHQAKLLESSLRRICTVEGAGGAVYADAVTRLLEAGGAALERVRGAGVPGEMPRALSHLQPVVCAGARRIGAALLAGDSRGSGDPLSVEPALSELALTHSTIQLYFAFLRRKAEVDASSLKEPLRTTQIEAVEKIIAECDLTRTAQDILAHYLTLERFFLEESVNKALKVSQTADSSSLVDDVFFIARKVIRRAASARSVDGLCAVLNEECAVLETRVAGALRRSLRSAPALVLPLAAPETAPAAAPAPSLLAQRLSRDVDAQRMLFLAHMNEAEAGAEWSERLASEACSVAESLVRSASEREKLQSCAAGLAGAAAAFRAASDLGAAALRAGLRPPVLAWAAQLVAPSAGQEDMVEDADALPAALDVLAEAARSSLSGRAADSLLAAVVGDIVERADLLILHNSYTREDGVVVERRARRLAAWSGGGARGARERCATLTQAAALLALDKPAHAHLALGPAARLSPGHAADVLARRVDFKIEEIKRLKL